MPCRAVALLKTGPLVVGIPYKDSVREDCRLARAEVSVSVEQALAVDPSGRSCSIKLTLARHPQHRRNYCIAQNAQLESLSATYLPRHAY